MIAQRKNGSSGCRRPGKIRTGRIFSETGGLDCFEFWTGPRKTGKRNGERLVLKKLESTEPGCCEIPGRKEKGVKAARPTG